jgi:hypothetical protein
LLVGSSSSSSWGAGSAHRTQARVARSRSPPDSAPIGRWMREPRNRKRASRFIPSWSRRAAGPPGPKAGSRTRHLTDDAVLRASAAFERAAPWADR